jgi:hypothetical protein
MIIIALLDFNHFWKNTREKFVDQHFGSWIMLFPIIKSEDGHKTDILISRNIFWFFIIIKVDMVSGVTQMLIRKTHKSWENQLQKQRRVFRRILLPRPRKLGPRDPWAMQQNLQQTGEDAGESPEP